MEGKLIFESDTRKIWQRNDGVIKVLYNRGANQEYDDLINGLDAVSEACDHRPAHFLIDIRELKSTDVKSSKYASSKEILRVIKSIAMITHNPLNRIIGNTFIKYINPYVQPECLTMKNPLCGGSNL